MTGPEPTEFDLYCCLHGFEGHGEGEYFRFCWECGHIYRTSEQLLSEFNQTGREAYEGLSEVLLGVNFNQMAPWVDETDVEKVFFCAWCTHDF